MTFLLLQTKNLAKHKWAQFHCNFNSKTGNLYFSNIYLSFTRIYTQVYKYLLLMQKNRFLDKGPLRVTTNAEQNSVRYGFATRKVSARHARDIPAQLRTEYK